MISAVEEASGLTRVYVWDLVVRTTHWLIALSILALSVTGIYMGGPYMVVSGEAGDHFVMGWMKTVHFYGAIVFTLAVLARLLWMLVGPRVASWRNFLPVDRKRRIDARGTLAFYLFVRDVPPPAVSHNPVAGMAYTAVFFLYLVMILTGLGLYAMSASVGSPLGWFDWFLPLFGGAQWARYIHHGVMWLLIGFFVHHVYSSILMAIVEKNGVLDSIFSGYKWIKRGERGP